MMNRMVEMEKRMNAKLDEVKVEIVRELEAKMQSQLSDFMVSLQQKLENNQIEMKTLLTNNASVPSASTSVPSTSSADVVLFDHFPISSLTALKEFSTQMLDATASKKLV